MVHTIKVSLIKNDQGNLSVVCGEPGQFKVTTKMHANGTPKMEEEDMTTFIGLILNYSSNKQNRDEIVEQWNSILRAGHMKSDEETRPAHHQV